MPDHPDAQVPWIDAVSGTLAFPAAPGLRFHPEVAVDGALLRPASWRPCGDGGAEAAVGDLLLRLVPRGPAAALELRNRGAAAVRLDAFRFVAAGSLLLRPGPELRVYCEGWTMTTPALGLRWGGREPELNPGYRPFAVPDPERYGGAAANAFHADAVAVLNHPGSGANLLLGFITSADQVARIAVELRDPGPSALVACCLGDGIAVPPGGAVASEELVAACGDDAERLLAAHAERWGRRMRARRRDLPRRGWCSWYHYFERVAEADVLENADWLAARRAEFPADYVQIDDGYQSALGDWLEADPVRFPHGLEWMAAEIRRRGFAPGLWLAPFLVEERSRLAATRPEWLVRDAAGAIVWVMDWRGCRTAVLDCTLPAACAWLERLFATLAVWGVAYAKLDFLVHAAAVAARGGVYADRAATRVQALRRGLEAIRRGFGEERVLLACTSVLGAGVGVVDACRVGSDFLPDWDRDREPFHEAPTVPNVCRNIINRAYLHRRLWSNDPDTIIVRREENRLDDAEVRLWASALWMVGGLAFSGDRLAGLDPERAGMLALLLRQLDAVEDPRPLDRFAEECPAVWIGRLRADPATAVVGAFNFGGSRRRFRVDPRAVGLGAARTLLQRELWRPEADEAAVAGIDLELPPHAARVLLLRAGDDAGAADRRLASSAHADRPGDAARACL